MTAVWQWLSSVRWRSVRKPQLTHHGLKARLLAQGIKQRVSLETFQSRVTQAQSCVEAIERLGRVTPLRINLSIEGRAAVAPQGRRLCQCGFGIRVAAELLVSHCQALLAIVVLGHLFAGGTSSLMVSEKILRNCKFSAGVQGVRSKSQTIAKCHYRLVIAPRR